VGTWAIACTGHDLLDNAEARDIGHVAIKARSASDNLTEELLERFLPAPGPCLQENSMVGRRFVDVVVQEPLGPEVEPTFSSQSSLAGDSIEVPKQRHREDDYWIDRRSASVRVEALDQVPHEREVDQLVTSLRKWSRGICSCRQQFDMRAYLESKKGQAAMVTGDVPEVAVAGS
jgi:hypothetical protein